MQWKDGDVMGSTQEQTRAGVSRRNSARRFHETLGLSINALARALRVPPNHVSGIVNAKRGISALMALRLARYFSTSAELWLGLQQDYELDTARDRALPRIQREVLPRAS